MKGRRAFESTLEKTTNLEQRTTDNGQLVLQIPVRFSNYCFSIYIRKQVI